MFKGEVLKRIREKKRITQDSLAEAIGKSKWTIWRMEKGSIVPTIDEIGALAARLGVSVSELTDSSDFDGVQTDRLVKSDMLKIPVLSREWTACCGNGIPALDITNPTDEFIPWPRDDFRALDDMRPPFAIYVEGDCLESIDIRDGDKVIINPAEEPPQGTVALTRRHGVLALRYVYRLKNGGVVLKCDLGTSALTPNDIEESDFAILGTLVGTFHPRPPALPL